MAGPSRSMAMSRPAAERRFDDSPASGRQPQGAGTHIYPSGLCSEFSIHFSSARTLMCLRHLKTPDSSITAAMFLRSHLDGVLLGPPGAMSHSSAVVYWQPTTVTPFSSPAYSRRYLGQEGMRPCPIHLAAGGNGKQRAHFALLDEGHGIHLVRKLLPVLADIGAPGTGPWTASHKKTSSQLVPQTRRNGQPPLGIQSVFIFPVMGRGPLSWDGCGKVNTFPHFSHLCSHIIKGRHKKWKRKITSRAC